MHRSVREDSPARRRIVLWIALGLLAAHLAQCLWAARRDSVTIDEFAHLPIGLHFLQTGDFSVDPANTPLARMIAAACVQLLSPTFAPEAGVDEWIMGQHLVAANPERVHEIFFVARLVIALFSAACGWIVWRWARALWGETAGLVALGLYAFAPSLLAHGHLITLDTAGTTGFMAAAWASWWMLDRPGPGRAAVLGLAVGLACLLKLSGLVVVPAIAIVVLLRADREPGYAWTAWARDAAVCLAAGLFTLNLGYGFQGIFAPLSAASLTHGAPLAALRESLPWLRLPLPLPFVNGMDMVTNVGHVQEPSYFLAGELSAEGWWYYHLAAVGLKAPLPLLLGACLGVIGWWRGWWTARRAACVVVPLIVVFATNSLFNSLYIGERHVLPVYPLLCLLAAPVFARPIEAAAARRRAGRPLTGRLGAGVLVSALGLCWYAGGTLAVAPRYLQYFNELAGGPDHGHEWLIGSNIDWGQDLIRLREWMDASGLPWTYLVYFGRIDPAAYGVRYRALTAETRTGLVAISASFLMGRPYFTFYDGRMRWMRHEAFTWLQAYDPVARVGSMFVFDLAAEPAR
jgi:hypothetical protein